MSDVDVALAKLAQRVVDLECATSMSVAPGAAIQSSEDAARVIGTTLASLKNLRSSLVTAATEIDSQLAVNARLEKENAKLRYQIKHLKRSLGAAEEYASSLLSLRTHLRPAPDAELICHEGN
jgi:hypothetical protein